LKRADSQGDARWLAARLPLIREKCARKLSGIAADRGFDSRASARLLEKADLFNAICAKNPRQMTQCLKDKIFAKAIRRRAQTEGRVGILKNVFFGGIPRAKGFENRQLQVSWAVLAHNLWVAARLPWAEDQRQRAQAA